MSEREIDLSKTDTRTAINIMMAESGVKSLADIARKLELKETTLRSAIGRGSLRLADFQEIAGSLGYEVILRSKA